MSSAHFTSSERCLATDRYVTISIDDGCGDDLRTAELLSRYGLQATFYIPARNPERPVIAAREIRELAKRFEIGSHTYNHAPLRFVSDERAAREIKLGKDWLEGVLGERVISFCYPRGKFNGTTPRLVKEAGFLGARTTLMDLHESPQNPFLCGISTQAYSHSKAIHIRHALLERNFVGIRNFFLYYKGTTDWQQHFLYALDNVQEHGGIAHLMLHSWEMEELGEWHKLDSVFDLISRGHMACVTNGNLFRLWSSSRVATPAMAEPVPPRS